MWKPAAFALLSSAGSRVNTLAVARRRRRVVVVSGNAAGAGVVVGATAEFALGRYWGSDEAWVGKGGKGRFWFLQMTLGEDIQNDATGILEPSSEGLISSFKINRSQFPNKIKK